MGSIQEASLNVCRRSLVLAVFIPAASLGPGCATSQDPGSGTASYDASSTSDADSADSAVGTDASADVAQGDAIEDVSDAQPEAEHDAESYCTQDSGSGEGSCSSGEVETGRCGKCGVRERTCDAVGAWKAWSPCSESPHAECALCDVSSVGCGFCGQRAVTCVAVGDTCRWMLGACDAAGACAPGSFEVDSATCAAGSAHVRQCDSGCHWSDWSSCSADLPRWDSLGAAPLDPRTAFVSAAANDTWIVWGGRDAQGVPLRDGARFDKQASIWSPLPEAVTAVADIDAGDAGPELLGPRSNAAAVWTGQEVLIWGGQGADFAQVLADGARFNPSSETWLPMTSLGAPSPRADATMVWDDASHAAIVWGGRSSTGAFASGGGRYDPATDAWEPVASAPISGRVDHTAVWAPSRQRMIVWGGRGPGGVPSRDGAEYDPSTDSWNPISDAPIAREGHVAFWDAKGDRLIVLLGRDGYWTGQRGDGAAWSPATGGWSLLADLSLSGYAIGDGAAAVFGAGHVWVTGGDGNASGVSLRAGARYDVSHDAWSALPAMNSGRSGHAAAFLDRVLVWGGRPASSGWSASTERLQTLP